MGKAKEKETDSKRKRNVKQRYILRNGKKKEEYVG